MADAWFAAVDADAGVRRLVQALALGDRFQIHLAVALDPRAAAALRRVLQARLAEPTAEAKTLTIYAPDGNIQDAVGLRTSEAALWQFLVPAAGAPARGEVRLLDLTGVSRDAKGDWLESWREVFRSLNQRRNTIAKAAALPVVLVVPPALERVFAESAPDTWSIRGLAIVLPTVSAVEFPEHVVRAPTERPTIGEPAWVAAETKALAARIEQFRSEPRTMEDWAALAIGLEQLARHEATWRMSPAAERHLGEAIEIWERLASQGWHTAAARGAAARSNRSEVLFALGRTQDALHEAQAAQRVLEGLVAAEPDRADLQSNLAISCIALGDLHRVMGRAEQARESFQKALDISERLARVEPDRTTFQRGLSVSYERIGDAYRTLGQIERARAAFEKALEITQRLAQAEPERADLQRDLSFAYNNLGHVYSALGQGDFALDAYQKALVIRERYAKAEPDRVEFARELAVSYIKLGDAYGALGQPEHAREALERALELNEQLAKAEPDRADFQRDLSISHERMGDLCGALGQGERARESFQKALDIRERLAMAEPDRADLQRDLAISCERMAMVTPAETAHGWIERAVRARRAVLASAPDQALLQRELGIALWQKSEMTQDRQALLEAAHLLTSLRRRGALEAQFIELADRLAPLVEDERSPGS